VGAVGELRGLIQATKVWFEVLAGFNFCYMIVFFAISKTEK